MRLSPGQSTTDRMPSSAETVLDRASQAVALLYSGALPILKKLHNAARLIRNRGLRFLYLSCVTRSLTSTMNSGWA